MRNVPADLQARLNGGATSICRCWKITRQDGRVLGFTDHDDILEFEGVKFEADSGMDASALQTSTGLSVDNGQAVGALSASAISETDIRAGKYDRAEVAHWLVDWQRPDLRVLMFRGHLGEIRRTDGVFEVELRGLAENLNIPSGRRVLVACDRVLGDKKCGFDVNLPGYAANAAVSEVVVAHEIRSTGLLEFKEGWFERGVVTWLSGDNQGGTGLVKSDRILNSGERSLGLWQEPSAAVRAGDQFRIVAGCNKQADTCADKFNNLLNFRGFPQLPNEDWVAAYPKDGVVHDGSSLKR